MTEVVSKDEWWELYVKLDWYVPNKIPSDCRVEIMSPLKFLSEVPSPCREGHTALEDIDLQGCWSESSFEYLKNQIREGKKLEAPLLDYSREFRGFPLHEGRHRALLAWELGEIEIPVIVCGRK